MNEKAKIAKEFLEKLGILKELDNPLLTFTAQNLVSRKIKDPTSCIYRLAMAIYHSGRFDRNILDSYEDPLEVFIKIVDNEEFNNSDPELVNEINNLSPEESMHFLRTFICFLGGAYIYYKVAEE